MRLSPLNQRRWRNFRRNRRAFWSLIIFSALFGASLLAEFIANDKPFLVSYRGELHFPVYRFYSETAFGGDFKTEAVYSDIEVKCLIISGGLTEAVLHQSPDKRGVPLPVKMVSQLTQTWHSQVRSFC